MSSTVKRTAPSPVYPPGWLVGQLPVGMRDDDLLVRFTTIFERVGETLRAGADGIEHVVDPTLTTPDMLVYLAAWLGYTQLDTELPIDAQRRLLAAFGRALPCRGTRRGLTLLLEAITDGPVRIEEPGGVYREGQAPRLAGEVVVTVTSTGHLRPHELESFVRDEVPAHLGVRVVVEAPDAAPPEPRSQVVDSGSPTSDHTLAGVSSDDPDPPTQDGDAAR